MPHRAAPQCRCGPKSHAPRAAAPRRRAAAVHGGGNWFEDAWGKIKNEFVNPNSKLRGEYLPAVAHEFTDPNSKLRSELVDKAASMGVPGAAQAKAANDQLRAIGLGKPRVRRAPSARNLVVRDVMREMGLSLPAASAYVKAHKLA